MILKALLYFIFLYWRRTHCIKFLSIFLSRFTRVEMRSAIRVTTWPFPGCYSNWQVCVRGVTPGTLGSHDPDCLYTSTMLQIKITKLLPPPIFLPTDFVCSEERFIAFLKPIIVSDRALIFCTLEWMQILWANGPSFVINNIVAW